MTALFQGNAPPPDSLRGVLDTVFANPRYRWVDPVETRSWLLDLWNRLGDWLHRFRAESPTAFNWFYFGLLVILAAILTHGLWVFYRAVKSSRQMQDGGVVSSTREVHDERWYRRRAQELAAAGRYAEAMGALFQAQVMLLDRREIVRFHPSKTPREYAREARLPSEERQAFLGLVRQLYRCSFAGERCGADEFREWQTGLMRDWHAAAG